MKSSTQLFFAKGMKEIASQYDGFIIDQWGVIHDGKTFYHGALETLVQLRDLGKPVVILTNSRKIAQRNIDRLTSMSVSRDMYTDLISSAELLRDLLVERPQAPWNELGKKVFIVAVKNDHALIDGTSYVSVPEIEQADFVLLLSTTEDVPESAHEHWINVAVENKIPVFSSSSDPLTVSPRGVFSGLAGIRETIRKRGGMTINVIVYEQCHKFMLNIRKKRIFGIGDQFATDVVGAKNYGIDAALVLTGAGEIVFQNAQNKSDIMRIVSALDKKHSVKTDIILPRLKWKD